MKRWLSLAFLLPLILCTGVAMQNDVSKLPSIGEKILADESLFSRDFIKTLYIKPMKEVVSNAKVWHAITETQRPKMADIQKKYGKPDSIIDEDCPALKSGSIETVGEPDPGPVPQRRLAIYYYGLVGFGVDKEKGDDTVVLITNLYSSAKKGTATAQQSPADKTKPVSRKTDNGFEVFLQQAKATKDRDPLNNVPTYRYGSCPPGAVLGDMKVLAQRGSDVIIVRLGIKVLPNYSGASLSLPVLLDADGKKYISSNTMLSDSLQMLLRRLKGTDDQLQCEFPFEIPKGTRVNKVQYEGVFFDLEDGLPRQP